MARACPAPNGSRLTRGPLGRLSAYVARLAVRPSTVRGDPEPARAHSTSVFFARAERMGSPPRNRACDLVSARVLPTRVVGLFTFSGPPRAEMRSDARRSAAFEGAWLAWLWALGAGCVVSGRWSRSHRRRLTSPARVHSAFRGPAGRVWPVAFKPRCFCRAAGVRAAAALSGAVPSDRLLAGWLTGRRERPEGRVLSRTLSTGRNLDQGASSSRAPSAR